MSTSKIEVTAQQSIMLQVTAQFACNWCIVRAEMPIAEIEVNGRPSTSNCQGVSGQRLNDREGKKKGRRRKVTKD